MSTVLCECTSTTFSYNLYQIPLVIVARGILLAQLCCSDLERGGIVCCEMMPRYQIDFYGQARSDYPLPLPLIHYHANLALSANECEYRLVVKL